MLSLQLLGAQGNLGTPLFRLSRLEWPGHYGPRGNALVPRRGLVRLGRILRRNFAIRGRTTAVFLPAAHFALFPIFLAALIVLAAGMTMVQVAVNPYVTIIGPSATASSRLNLSQAFNSVGTFIAPFLGSLFILRGAKPISPAVLHSMSESARQLYQTAEAASVRLPYIGIVFALVLLAVTQVRKIEFLYSCFRPHSECERWHNQ